MPVLAEMLRELPCAAVQGDPNIEITGLAYDSRLVKPGDLFVALPGFHVDGSGFIPAAVERGAVAVLTQRPDAPPTSGLPRILVPDARRALTDLSAALYGYPARRLRVVGVTGTDGKTTTSYLVSAVLEAMGYRTGIITTVDVKVGDDIRPNETQHTTPEPVEVQALLREMVDAGVDYAVLEASSHALALDRLLHCEFDVAVFTNLSAEHLNFHGSMENYLRDKARLFAMLDGAVDKGVGKTAILNAADPHAARIAEATGASQIWYGLGSDGSPSVRAENVELFSGGSRFLLVTPIGSVPMESRLAGRFNVYNWLAACSVGLSQGATLEQLRSAVASVGSVPGRMERVEAGQPFTVLVDFAHTPQALATAMGAIRSVTPGRLIVLFGQAGERDPGNRPAMGRLAAGMADFALFTTDDPRFEDPMEIAEQIAEAAREAGWREGEHYLKVAGPEGGDPGGPGAGAARGCGAAGGQGPRETPGDRGGNGALERCRGCPGDPGRDGLRVGAILPCRAPRNR